MLKKAKIVALVGLLALLLSACNVGGGANKTGDDGSVAQNLNAAIATVPGVESVDSRYTVKSGMGSSVTVRITAEAGTPSLETVMEESLRAFAGASDGINTTSKVSFQVTEVGQENTITPTALGLPQKPSVTQIIAYANGAQ